MQRGRQTSAPANYVAGLGRGAIGFTTRSDIGPAREALAPGIEDVASISMPQPPPGYVAGAGRGMGDLARSQGELPLTAARKKPDGDDGNYNDSNYDQFAGYGGALFRDTPYEEDDAQADRIYEAIDERMDSRRKRAREEKMLETIKKYRDERPKISDQFADLKRELQDVSKDDWEAIPEVGDHSLRLKQKRHADSFTPVPDTLIEGFRNGIEGGTVANLDLNQQMFGGAETPMGGSRTPMGGWKTPMLGGSTSVAGTASSLTSGLAAARGTVLGLKLDKMSDSVTGQTVVDPKGYLTDLNSIKVNTDSEVGDIKKARLLLKSVTTTNPKHPPGWIAAARVEEYSGRVLAARKIIKEGCETCPESEDIWLEAARLQTADNAKAVLASAVHHLPTSVKIWLHAAELETESQKRKVILRRALEFVPNSVKLWRTAIELESAEDARIMLGRAVECVPHSVDMWLALARLETYDNAKSVLNQAREAIPTEPSIWITAAKLEEARDNEAEIVERIIEKAISSLSQYQVVIDREAWLKEAEAAELAGSPATCGSIVRNTIGIGVEAEDRKRTWLDDAESALTRNAVETGRAIFAHALGVFPGKKSLWLCACTLEKKHGTPESLDHMLKKAVSYCPQAEILWLMAAKEKWLTGDVTGARNILMEAFAANPDSEKVWLAAVKIEWENDEFARARILLAKARARAPTERVWMKSAQLERESDDILAELTILDEAIIKYPTFAKFYMMAGQANSEGLKNYDRAREYYQQGLRRCPDSIPLWRLATQLEELTKGVTKARSILELARLKNPKNPTLWLEATRLEARSGNDKMSSAIMAKALQECPESGILWAEEIAKVPRAQQKAKSLDALKRCDNNPDVIVAVAQLFSVEGKYAKARKWFNRAVTLDPDLGDAWAAWYAFEQAHGSEQEQNDVLTKCVAAEPAHGARWCAQSKDVKRRRNGVAANLTAVAAALAI